MGFEFQISPIIGFIVGINFADYGSEAAEEFGWSKDLQIALGVILISIKW